MKTSMIVLCLALGMALAATPASTSVTDAVVSDVNPTPAVSSLLRPGDAILSPGSRSLPPTDPPGDTLHVDLEVFNNAVGLTAGGVFYTAARLTPAVACTVATVIFYKWTRSNNDYLFVWGAGSTTQPGAVIESVPYSGSTTMAWQSIDLPVPVPRAANEDIWVGPRINHTLPDSFPLGVDDGPAVATRGDWINYQGAWVELRNVSTIDADWHIRAILGHGAPLGNDVGCSQILAPPALMEPGQIEPKVKFRNFGTEPQDSFPVTCWIDSAGSRVYTNTVTWTGTLPSGGVDSVTFPTWTASQGTFDIKMFTDLSNDSNRANDTIRGQTEVGVQGLSWSELTPAPSPGRYWCPGTGVCRDTIWFLGGRLAAQVSTRSITAYDIASGTWITSGLPTLTTPRRAGGGGRIGNKIYIAGGRDSASTTLNTCDEFDLDTKTFTPKANMPGSYWAVASAVAGDKLYIVGNDLQTGTTYEYNPAGNTWATKAAMSVGRGWACAAGSRGLVYAMGGSDAGGATLNDCWCLNPATNQWTRKASMPGPRIYSSGIAYNDSVIYVVGGSTDGAVAADNLVYVYDIAGDTWSTEAPKPTASGWHMVNVVDGAMYVAYGSDCVTPTYLTNLDKATLPPAGIEMIDLIHPEAICRISPSVVRDFARIDYSVTRTARVELGIYDAAGSLVRTLVNGTLESGSRNVTWNRTDNSGRRVANGTYFYRLTIGGRSASGKAVLLQ